MSHGAALLVGVGRLSKAAPKALVQFGISSAHFSVLSSFAAGLIHWWLTAALATLALLGSAVVGQLYFSNECFCETEGDASRSETPVHFCGMEC